MTSRGRLAAALILVFIGAVALILAVRSNTPGASGLVGIGSPSASAAPTSGATATPVATPDASASVSAPPSGSASITSTGADASSAPAGTIPKPRTTPPGTPGPIPDTAIATSAKITKPAPGPETTPAPQPGLWRIDGYVVDEDNTPLPGTCVVIGPHGCQTYSPHTDDRGYWFIDIAEGQAQFDFYVERPGYQTVWLHVQPKGPTEYDVILKKG